MSLQDLDKDLDPFDLEPLLGDHITPATYEMCAVHESQTEVEFGKRLITKCGAINVHRWFYFPPELQVRVWGIAHIRENGWVCATSLDNIRSLIAMYLGGSLTLEALTDEQDSKLVGVAGAEIGYAVHAIDCYEKARNVRSDNIKSSPYAVKPEEWRCPTCGTGMIPLFNGQKSYMHTCVYPGERKL